MRQSLGVFENVFWTECDGIQEVSACASGGTRIVILKQLHPGIVAMKQRLRTKVFWLGIDKGAQKVCKACHDVS